MCEAADLDSGVLASVDVHSLLGVGVQNDNLSVVDVIFYHPLAALLALCPGRLSGRRCFCALPA